MTHPQLSRKLVRLRKMLGIKKIEITSQFRTGSVLLCIDIDGVFNPHRLREEHEPEINKTTVYYLNKIMESVPNCKVLISSSWGISALPELVKQGFEHESRVVGGTGFSGEKYSRTIEIVEWLDEAASKNIKFDRVIMLDDEPELFNYFEKKYGANRYNCVFVKGDVGLDESASYEVICKLQGFNFRFWA